MSDNEPTQMTPEEARAVIDRLRTDGDVAAVNLIQQLAMDLAELGIALRLERVLTERLAKMLAVYQTTSPN